MIVRCPHCAAEVDEEAAHCPSCSWDFENKRKVGEPPPPDKPGLQGAPPAAVPPPLTEVRSVEHRAADAPYGKGRGTAEPDSSFRGDAAQRFRKVGTKPEVVLAPSSEKMEGRARRRQDSWKIYAATVALLTGLSLAVFYYTTLSETPVARPSGAANPFKAVGR